MMLFPTALSGGSPRLAWPLLALLFTALPTAAASVALHVRRRGGVVLLLDPLPPAEAVPRILRLPLLRDLVLACRPRCVGPSSSSSSDRARGEEKEGLHTLEDSLASMGWGGSVEG